MIGVNLKKNGTFNDGLSSEKKEVVERTADYWVSMIKKASDESDRTVIQLADVLGMNHESVNEKNLIKFKLLLSKYIIRFYPKKGSCCMIWTGDGDNFIGDNYLINIAKSSKIAVLSLPYDVCTIIRPGSVQAEERLQLKDIYRKKIK